MSSDRGAKLFPVLGVLLMVAACSQMSGAASPDDQAVAVKRAGGACQSDDGRTVADGTIVSKCAMPGQGIMNCPRYVCSRCTSGAWGGEYTCQMR